MMCCDDHAECLSKANGHVEQMGVPRGEWYLSPLPEVTPGPATRSDMV